MAESRARRVEEQLTCELNNGNLQRIGDRISTLRTENE